MKSVMTKTNPFDKDLRPLFRAETYIVSTSTKLELDN